MKKEEYNYICHNGQRGYVALLATLVGAALSSSLIATHILQGISSTQATLVSEQSLLALGYAEGCAEQALEQIRQSTPYSGSGSMSFDRGECTYSVINLGAQARRIDVEGVSDDVVRRVRIEVLSISPAIEIDSWQQVTNF